MNTTVKRAILALTVFLITPSVATAASAGSNLPSTAQIEREAPTYETGRLTSKVFSDENFYYRAAAAGGGGDEHLFAFGFDMGLDIKGEYSQWGVQLNLGLQNYRADRTRTLAFMMASVNLGFVGGGVGVIASPRGSKGEGGWFWAGTRQLRVEGFVNAPLVYSERGSVGLGFAGEVFDVVQYRLGVFLSGTFYNDTVYAHLAYRVQDRLWVTAKIQGGDEAFGSVGLELRR